MILSLVSAMTFAHVGYVIESGWNTRKDSRDLLQRSLGGWIIIDHPLHQPYLVPSHPLMVSNI